jgi:hypothetical protein
MELLLITPVVAVVVLLEDLWVMEVSVVEAVVQRLTPLVIQELLILVAVVVLPFIKMTH